ncbi:MAG: ATP-binding cassette domain-containing protein [Clostridia bacterium]
MLKIKNLHKSFNAGTIDETTLFDGFNIDIKRGQFVSIIGSNGSGKSTLLNLICGTLTQDSGDILVEDKNINSLQEFKRGKFIGRVLQDPKLGTCGDLTILENMSLADNKGKKFGLSFATSKSRIQHYKKLLSTCNMGLENRLDAKVGLLSGGQRQALALIIANMVDIDFLILDEHTAALDPKSSETIMQLTQKLVEQKGITTLMVTHNLRHAQEYGNRLVMMHEGKIVIDVEDEAKEQFEIEQMLKIFNEISIECGN